MDSTLTQKLFLLEPQYRERVWGGQRLKPSDPPIGEAWVAFAECLVRGGAHAGRTVSDLGAAYGAEFLGREVAARYTNRFPLLIKLLDCADWLSVQVHPDDEQAARLVGPGEPGKSEAWHFLEADAGATIYAGVKPGTSPEALKEAISDGRILDVIQPHDVVAGSTMYIPAGTLHALGPGLLLYEVQQSSDTTYRVYDWGRPISAGRKLHVRESAAVADPRLSVVLRPAPTLHGTSRETAVACPFFDLDVVQVSDAPFEADTGGEAFHLLTITAGNVEISCGVETGRLGCYDTVLVAGGAGAYELRAAGGAAKVLKAVVPRSGEN